MSGLNGIGQSLTQSVSDVADLQNLVGEVGKKESSNSVNSDLLGKSSISISKIAEQTFKAQGSNVDYLA